MITNSFFLLYKDKYIRKQIFSNLGKKRKNYYFFVNGVPFSEFQDLGVQESLNTDNVNVIIPRLNSFIYARCLEKVPDPYHLDVTDYSTVQHPYSTYYNDWTSKGYQSIKLPVLCGVESHVVDYILAQLFTLFGTGTIEPLKVVEMYGITEKRLKLIDQFSSPCDRNLFSVVSIPNCIFKPGDDQVFQLLVQEKRVYINTEYYKYLFMDPFFLQHRDQFRLVEGWDDYTFLNQLFQLITEKRMLLEGEYLELFKWVISASSHFNYDKLGGLKKMVKTSTRLFGVHFLLDKNLFKKLFIGNFAASCMDLLEFVIQHYNQEFVDHLCGTKSVIIISNDEILKRFLIYCSPIPEEHKRFRINISQQDKQMYKKCLQVAEEFNTTVQSKNRAGSVKIKPPVIWSSDIRLDVDPTLLKSIEQGNQDFVSEYLFNNPSVIQHISDLLIGTYKSNQYQLLYFLLDKHTDHLDNDQMDSIYFRLLKMAFMKLENNLVMDLFYDRIKCEKLKGSAIVPYIGKVYKSLSKSNRETKEKVIVLVEFIKSKYILLGCPLIENSSLTTLWEFIYLQDEAFFTQHLNLKIKVDVINLKILVLKYALDKGSLAISKYVIENSTPHQLATLYDQYLISIIYYHLVKYNTQNDKSNSFSSFRVLLYFMEKMGSVKEEQKFLDTLCFVSMNREFYLINKKLINILLQQHRFRILLPKSIQHENDMKQRCELNIQSLHKSIHKGKSKAFLKKIQFSTPLSQFKNHSCQINTNSLISSKIIKDPFNTYTD
ncbi:hypothetical protein CYY_003626 [Polysphondylium violaceum]|uniref:Uncharacterized protein n=1 Tax=Polysphondylium violaceum TaxID=133409 RepID=A0A8J4V8H6_9MYCE|nr:hypothetical protein CYY_003626 [Polysphondylium violaceum]